MFARSFKDRCLEASLSQSCIYGVVSMGLNRTGAMMAVQASRK